METKQKQTKQNHKKEKKNRHITLMETRFLKYIILHDSNYTKNISWCYFTRMTVKGRTRMVLKDTLTCNNRNLKQHVLLTLPSQLKVAVAEVGGLISTQLNTRGVDINDCN